MLSLRIPVMLVWLSQHAQLIEKMGGVPALAARRCDRESGERTTSQASAHNNYIGWARREDSERRVSCKLCEWRGGRGVVSRPHAARGCGGTLCQYQNGFILESRNVPRAPHSDTH